MLIDICKYLLGVFAGTALSVIVLVQFIRSTEIALSIDPPAEQS